MNLHPSENKNKQHILFVCLGNICRSPAAEGIFKHQVEQAGLSSLFEIDSAGTYGGHAGEPADARMREAARKRGYNLTSRSRQIRSEDFDRFDRIIVMDDSNYERVHRLAPDRETADKIYRMADFSDDPNVDHIPDPYYEGREGFEKVLNLLEGCCRNLLAEVSK